jgi:hypothetical protein
MELFLLTFVVISCAVLGMAVGVLCGRPSIKGSCGGLGGQCPTCTGKCEQQKREPI